MAKFIKVKIFTDDNLKNTEEVILNTNNILMIEHPKVSDSYAILHLKNKLYQPLSESWKKFPIAKLGKNINVDISYQDLLSKLNS